MSDPYAPHRDFVRLADPDASWGDIAKVFGAYVAAFFLVPIGLFVVLAPSHYAALYAGSSPLATFGNFAIFGVTAYVMLWAVDRVHGRGFWSLIGDYRHALHDFRVVAVGVAMLLFFVQIILPFGTWGEVGFVRNAFAWLLFLPLALIVILIQVSTEELLFRGYLQQQLARMSESRLVWMIAPSVVFGAWHYWNGNSPPEGFVYAIWAGLLGIACADLTARTGTLGAAIGLHFAVNVLALIFIGIEDWPMTGFALVLLDYINPDLISAEIAQAPDVWVIFNLIWAALSILTIWLAARIAIRR